MVRLMYVAVQLKSKTYHIAMVYDGSTLKYYRNGFFCL